MRIVLDTNVLVSGLLSASSIPGAILQFVLDGNLELCINDAIVGEYDDVLRRPKFSFSTERIDDVLLYIEGASHRAPPATKQLSLPDPKDVPFLDAAIAGDVEYLVTGNTRHFPAEQCFGIAVVSPADFLIAYQRATM